MRRLDSFHPDQFERKEMKIRSGEFQDSNYMSMELERFTGDPKVNIKHVVSYTPKSKSSEIGLILFYEENKSLIKSAIVPPVG